MGIKSTYGIISPADIWTYSTRFLNIYQVANGRNNLAVGARLNVQPSANYAGIVTFACETTNDELSIGLYDGANDSKIKINPLNGGYSSMPPIVCVNTRYASLVNNSPTNARDFQWAELSWRIT